MFTIFKTCLIFKHHPILLLSQTLIMIKSAKSHLCPNLKRENLTLPFYKLCSWTSVPIRKLFVLMLFLLGFEGKESRLAAIVTLASSLDYTSSKSTLKLLLPLVSLLIITVWLLHICIWCLTLTSGALKMGHLSNRRILLKP